MIPLRDGGGAVSGPRRRPNSTDWIARGWVAPEGSTRADWVFADIDLARIRLIRDLRLRMALEEDALALGAVAARPDLRIAGHGAGDGARARRAAAGGARGRAVGHRRQRRLS